VTRTYPVARYMPWLLGVCAFIYLGLLAVKSYSGVFTSTDSADFLMASTVWAIPQTYGYPLYILLGHFLNLFPGDLAAKMTVILSVSFVFLIAKRLTNRTVLSVVVALVLLSTAVFLTEATITKGYALTAMFLVIAYYCYLREWRLRTTLFLGLATAIHMMVIFIAILWLIGDRRWRYWLGKPLLVYIATGLLPYVMIPVLMALDTPRFMAGSLSIENLKGYWSGTGRAIIGMLSVFDVPSRWLLLGKILLVSTGLAFIPLLQYKIYQLHQRHIAVLVAAPVFMLWYVATCLDVQVWTYLAVGAPFIAILVGLGLARMRNWHMSVIALSALCLIVVNGVFLNANVITRDNPYMTDYKQSLEALPDNSVVVVVPGAYSLGLFYTIADGKNLVPLVYSYLELDSLMGMKGYDTYLEKHYGVTWPNTLEGVQQCLDTNRTVYIVPVEHSQIQDCFVYAEPIEYTKLNRVVGLTGQQPEVLEMSTNE